MPSALKLNDSLLSVSNTMLTTPIPAPSEKTWQLQNSPKFGTSYTTDWMRSSRCRWANIYGGGLIGRTYELLQGGYLDANGLLTGCLPGTTGINGPGVGLGYYMTDAVDYYTDRVLVFEVTEGDLGDANTLNPAGWNNPTTLNRKMNVMDTGNGVQTVFTIAAATGQAAGTTAKQLRVFVDGVRQAAGTDYTVADNADTTSLNVTFTAAPADGAVLAFKSERKEVTLVDPSLINTATSGINLSIGDPDQIVGLGVSVWDKEHEDDVYDAPNNPWKMIHPGIREYLDHADVVRTLDMQNRVSISSATSFAETGSPDSYGWGCADDGYRVSQPWYIHGIYMKSGVPFQTIASYCEQYNKTLWYHAPGFLLSPVRKAMLGDADGKGAARGWFSPIWTDPQNITIVSNTDKGWVTLNPDVGGFDYDPLDDQGRGNAARFWEYEDVTADGATSEFRLVGQYGRTDLRVTASNYQDWDEGTDYTLANDNGDLLVQFTFTPTNGTLIRFVTNADPVYFTIETPDPRNGGAPARVVIPLRCVFQSTGPFRVQPWGSYFWGASDAVNGVNNVDWFTAAHRWQYEAAEIVDRLVESGYSSSRELILEWSNEVWNTAPEFEPDTMMSNGVANYYGLNGAAGHGIQTGFLKKYVDLELVNRSLSYNITWACASHMSNLGTTYNRYIGAHYFWENIEGLNTTQSAAKILPYECFGTMYYGQGFKDNANTNCTGLSGSAHSDQVLAWLATSEATLEANYLSWLNGVNHSFNVQYILNLVDGHKSRAESGGSIFRGFYEGGDGSTSWPSALTGDTDFVTWWSGAWTGDFGAQMWRDVSDALIAQYPTIMLSHYGATQNAVFSNPWHTGPWEAGDTPLFAAMRDEYGTGFIG